MPTPKTLAEVIELTHGHVDWFAGEKKAVLGEDRLTPFAVKEFVAIAITKAVETARENFRTREKGRISLQSGDA